ncbi:MAG: hypothetical protein S4CHLAM20_06630 [Chlamydiia bacterium]|nr:hypothetical protein [Chlamydiia bacterium]
MAIGATATITAETDTSSSPDEQVNGKNDIQDLGPVTTKAKVSVGFRMVDGEPQLIRLEGEEEGVFTNRGDYGQTGTKAYEAAVYGLFLAPSLRAIFKTTGEVLGGLATTGSDLKDAAGKVGEFAEVCENVDRYTSFFGLPVKAIMAGMDIKAFIEASKEDKVERGCDAAASVLKVGATSVKAAKIIGTEFGSVSKTVAKILGWVSYGLKIIAEAFNIFGAAKSLAKDRFAIPQEKTAAIMKVVQAIVSIAFFAFMVVATIFSFGMAGVIAGAVLGGLFGIGLLVTGIYKAHVDRLKSGLAVTALHNNDVDNAGEVNGSDDESDDDGDIEEVEGSKSRTDLVEEARVANEAREATEKTLQELQAQLAEQQRLREEAQQQHEVQLASVRQGAQKVMQSQRLRLEQQNQELEQEKDNAIAAASALNAEVQQLRAEPQQQPQWQGSEEEYRVYYGGGADDALELDAGAEVETQDAGVGAAAAPDAAPAPALNVGAAAVETTAPAPGAAAVETTAPAPGAAAVSEAVELGT